MIKTRNEFMVTRNGLSDTCFECDLGFNKDCEDRVESNRLLLQSFRDFKRAYNEDRPDKSIAVLRPKIYLKRHKTRDTHFKLESPRSTPEGYVYFIVEEDRPRIKVGYSKDVHSRLINLQTSHSSKLVLLGYFKGSVRDEKLLHREFAKFRIHGEWFNFSLEIKEFLIKNGVLSKHQITRSTT